MNFCEVYQIHNHHEITSRLLREKTVNAFQQCRHAYIRELYPKMILSQMGTKKVVKSFGLMSTCVFHQSIK